MFNWFWRFLYSISEILYELIDGLMSIANMLCGIEPITVKGEKTEFLLYLLESNEVKYGFMGATFIAIFLLMIFSIFSMIKAIKEQSKLTPAQICVKVCKTLGIYLFIPAVMIVFTKLINELMLVMYTATSFGASSMGDFLFKAFLPPDIDASGSFVDYTSTVSVEVFINNKGFDLSDYRFFFSWIVCVPLLISLAKGLMNFVDRTVSIVLLYIVSPVPLSASMIDDGEHFKLWRDQVLIKFLNGYGIIIGLNIYILICSLISRSDVTFFNNSFLNFLFKVAFMLGGAVSLERTMALVGNLVSSGAGSQEQAGATQAFNAMKGIGAGVLAAGKGILKAPIKAANLVNDIAHKGVGQVAAEAVGLKTEHDYAKEGFGKGGGPSTQDKILAAIQHGNEMHEQDRQERQQQQQQEQNEGGGVEQQNNDNKDEKEGANLQHMINNDNQKKEDEK